MTRVGLVLGAGGVDGRAYHAGVLAILEHDFGFDPRTVDMIVGTSAGSITGTRPRLGVKAEDLAAWTVKAPLSGDDDELRQIAATPCPCWHRSARWSCSAARCGCPHHGWCTGH